MNLQRSPDRTLPLPTLNPVIHIITRNKSSHVLILGNPMGSLLSLNLFTGSGTHGWFEILKTPPMRFAQPRLSI